MDHDGNQPLAVLPSRTKRELLRATLVSVDFLLVTIGVFFCWHSRERYFGLAEGALHLSGESRLTTLIVQLIPLILCALAVAFTANKIKRLLFLPIPIGIVVGFQYFEFVSAPPNHVAAALLGLQTLVYALAFGVPLLAAVLFGRYGE